jgi:cell wall-associated NlpC family hydrolase
MNLLDLALENCARHFVVQEARSWIGTPYHLGARVKGAGCDCYTFIAETMISCHVIRNENLPIYSGDWWAHVTTEQYLFRLLRYAVKTFEGLSCVRDRVLPGNVVATIAPGTESRVFNHGAVVTSWPFGIHSVDDGVVEVDLTEDPMWHGSQIKAFDPWVKNA